MGTVGRLNEPRRFLESLSVQNHEDLELIVIDQNPDDRLVPVLAAYRENFPVVHLRSERGLSRARNAGLKRVTGDIVAFPDDDCWYPPDLLERVARWFATNPEWAGLTGRSVDDKGRTSMGRWMANSGEVSRFDVWRKAISFSIFLRKAVVDRVYLFDDSLGLGAGTPWGSGEETDYVLRALDAGFRIYYEPTVWVHHHEPTQDYDAKRVSRAYSYARGMGRVLRKHRYPIWFVLYQWIRPLAGTLLSLLVGRSNKARYFWAVFQGRVLGWVAKQ